MSALPVFCRSGFLSHCLSQSRLLKGRKLLPHVHVICNYVTSSKWEGTEQIQTQAASHSYSKGNEKPTDQERHTSSGQNGSDFLKDDSFGEHRSQDGEDWARFQDTSHDAEKEYETSVKQQILNAALNNVHEFGWTHRALEAGAKNEGLPTVAHGMFPRRGAEIIEHFSIRSNADLVEYMKQELARLEAEDQEKLKVQPFIQNAVETRLKMILPYKDIWKKAIAIQTLPPNAVNSWRNLMNLTDDIWFYAGDRSVDFNWYTKRLSLAAVYKSTEIFMLQDNSLGQLETWNFLERRLDDVQKLGAATKKFTLSSDVLKEGLLGLCTMGRNMLGMNRRNR